MNPSESHPTQPQGIFPTLKRGLIALAIGFIFAPISGFVTVILGLSLGIIEVTGTATPALQEIFTPQMMRILLVILALLMLIACVSVFQTIGRDLELKMRWPFTVHELTWGLVAIVVDLASVFFMVEVSMFTDTQFLEVLRQLANSTPSWQILFLDVLIAVAFPIVDVLFYQGFVQQYLTRVSSKTGGVIATTIVSGIIAGSPILAIAMIPRAIVYAQRHNLLATIGTFIIVSLISGTFLYILL